MDTDAFDLFRRAFAKIADGAGAALLVWLGWQVMFGGSQPFENHAAWIGLVGVAACWADPDSIKRASWPMLIYVASGLFSAAMQRWSDDATIQISLGHRLGPAAHLVTMAAFVYGVAYLMRTPTRLAAFVGMFVAATGVLATQILFDRVGANFFFIRVGSTSLPSVAQWAGLHQTGLVLMLAFPMVAAGALSRPPRTLFAASLVLGVGLLIVAYLNGSRSGLITMVLIALVMALVEVLRRVTAARTRVMIALVSLFLAVGFVAIVATRTAALRPSASVTGERGAIWHAAMQLFLDHFWLGVGPGNYSVEMVNGGYAARYLPLYPVVSTGVDQAHNLFLHTAAETGVVGAVALIVFLAALLRSCWRAWIAFDGGIVACGILFVLLAFAMRSMLDDFLDLRITAERIRVLVWMMFAAALAVGNGSRVMVLKRM